jgi:hypothetical protein
MTCVVSAQEFMAHPDSRLYFGVHTENEVKDSRKKEYTRWACGKTVPHPTFMCLDEFGKLCKFKPDEPWDRGLKAEVFYTTYSYVRHLNAYLL